MEYLEFTDLLSYLIFGIFILLMIFEKFNCKCCFLFVGS